MPNPPSFELEAAIRRWRESLAMAPALRGDDLDELENHLRESVYHLESQGNNSETAFQLACEQMGPSPTLADEFAKANPSELWIDRALWALVGLLLLRWVSIVEQVAEETVIGLMMSHGASQIKMGVTYLLMPLLIKAGICWGVWHLATRSCGVALMRHCLKWPWLLVLSLLLLYQYRYPVLQNLFAVFSSVAASLLNLNPASEIGRHDGSWMRHLMRWREAQIVIGALPLYLALYYLLRSYKWLKVNRTDATLGPSPNEQSVNQPMNAYRLIWIERFIWMLGSNLLIAGVLAPAMAAQNSVLFLLAFAHIPVSSFAALLDITVRPIIIWLVVSVVWKRGVRHDPYLMRLGRAILNQPAGFLGLLFLCVRGPNYLESALFTNLLLSHDFSPSVHSFALFQWTQFSLFMVVPTFLMVWLACWKLGLPFIPSQFNQFHSKR